MSHRPKDLSSDPEPRLDDPWPSFLDLLDEDPEAAWVAFFQFVWKLSRLHLPPVLRSLPEEVREDLLADLIQDFQASNFRLLRTYQNRGLPFASWFWRILRNRALDRMKYENRRRHKPLSEAFHDHGVSPERLVEIRELLGSVHRVLGRLNPQCQILLQAAAEGYTSRELQVLLGLGAGGNKKHSDQLRYCRKKLKAELERLGISVEFNE